MRIISQKNFFEYITMKVVVLSTVASISYNDEATFMFTSRMKNKKTQLAEKIRQSFKISTFLKDRGFLKHKFFYLTLAAVIIFIGVLARTYHLTSLPPGVYPDEAVNGTDAIKAIETGHFQWFYTNNYGREGLFMNLIAMGFLFFGVNVITLKIWSVFFGILTIAGMMLLSREIFGTYRSGLIAGFLYATSFWAINFNRISFRANMLPFVLVFTFYFLFKGLREKRYADYVWAGVFFGLGVHGYIAFRIAPAILVALFLAFWIIKKRFLRTYWKEITLFAVSAFIVALPMLVTFYAHPEYFETRSESVSVLSPKVNQGHLWQALWTSTTKTLGMFNFHGDENWRHNFPPKPELQFIVGIFFLIGIAILVFYLFYFLYRRFRRGERNERFIIAVLLLSWLFAMLLPGLLTYEGLPHSLRTIGALPAALLIATFALEKSFSVASRVKNRHSKNGLIALLVILLITSGTFSLKQYFIDWAGAPEIHSAFSRNFKNMALYLNNLPPGPHKYVVANAGGQIMDDGLPVSAHVVELLTHYKTPGIIYMRPDFDVNILQSPAKIVLMYYNGEVIAKVKEKFPHATVQKLDPQPGSGTDYFVINVN